MVLRVFIIICLCSPFVNMAHANKLMNLNKNDVFQEDLGQYSQQLHWLIDNKIRQFIENEDFSLHVSSQNDKISRFTNKKFKALEKKWQKGNDNVINSIVDNNISNQLREFLKNSEGVFEEILVVSNNATLISRTHKDSNHWHEYSLKNVFPFNNSTNLKEISVSEINFDEVNKSFNIDLAMPILNNANKVGTIVFNIDIEKL